MSILYRSALLGLGLLAFVGTTANARVHHYRHFRHAYYGVHPYYGRLAPHYGVASGAAPSYGYGSSLPGAIGSGAGTNAGP